MDTYSDPRILALEKRHLEGQQLSPEEIELARVGMGSPHFIEKIISCEALLRNAVPAALESLALETLQEMCSAALREQDDLNPRLLLSLLWIPSGVLLKAPEFKQLAHKAVRSQSSACRMNAVMVLERFARQGDGTAKELLRDAAGDPDPHVKHNATRSLERLTA